MLALQGFFFCGSLAEALKNSRLSFFQVYSYCLIISLNRSTKLAKILAMVKMVDISSLSHSVAMILSCIQVIHLLQNKVSKQLIILSVNPGIFDSTIGTTRDGSMY